MSSESRRGLRIALCFTVAFVLAELLRIDLQLTFLAPLVAGALAVGPAVGAIRLIVLPIFAWLLVALAGVAMQFLAREPVVLGLLTVWIFYLGFRMFADPRNATVGLVLLLVFGIVPQSLVKAPELSGDRAFWFGMYFGIAAACEWATRRLLPDAAPI